MKGKPIVAWSKGWLTVKPVKWGKQIQSSGGQMMCHKEFDSYRLTEDDQAQHTHSLSMPYTYIINSTWHMGATTIAPKL